MMNERRQITTKDNPYNPFTDFTLWYMFDCEKGHNTCSRLARIAKVESEMTQKEIDEELERVMELMIKHDFGDEFYAGTQDEIENFLKTREKQNATAVNA